MLFLEGFLCSVWPRFFDIQPGFVEKFNTPWVDIRIIRQNSCLHMGHILSLSKVCFASLIDMAGSATEMYSNGGFGSFGCPMGIKTLAGGSDQTSASNQTQPICRVLWMCLQLC